MKNIRLTALTKKQLLAFDHSFTEVFIHGFFATINCFPNVFATSDILKCMFAGELNDQSPSLLLNLIDYKDSLLNLSIQEKLKLPSGCSIPKENWKQIFDRDHKLNQWSRGARFAIDCLEDNHELDDDTFDKLSIYYALIFFTSESDANNMLTGVQITKDLKTQCKEVRRLCTQLINIDIYERFNLEEDDDIDYFDELNFPELDTISEMSRPDELQIDSWHDLLERAYEHKNPNVTVQIADEIIEQSKLIMGPNFGIPEDMNVWLEIDARPALRAMYLKADVYFDLKQWKQSRLICEELLQLSPGDNLGVRYLYIIILCHQRDWTAVENLMIEYNENSVWFVFTKVLMCYLNKDSNCDAEALAADARHCNKYVIKYLTGQLKIPNNLPDAYSYGSKEEAIFYALKAKVLWQQADGALFWLKKNS